MKLSKVFHVLNVIIGFVGVIALFSAWIAGKNGTVLGFNQDHLFKDAQILILIAIWISIATIHHLKLEEKGKII